MIPLLPDTGSVDTASAIVFVILAGVLGAIAKIIIDGKGFKLPNVSEGTLNLGFIGAIIIGGIAGGYLGDSILGAFTAGLSASAIIGGIVSVASKPILEP